MSATAGSSDSANVQKERSYEKTAQEARIENIYRLEGRVPVAKAIPFGLQHVLAMFVANIAPLIIISSVAVYNGQPFTAV